MVLGGGEKGLGRGGKEEREGFWKRGERERGKGLAVEGEGLRSGKRGR